MQLLEDVLSIIHVSFSARTEESCSTNLVAIIDKYTLLLLG